MLAQGSAYFLRYPYNRLTSPSTGFTSDPHHGPSGLSAPLCGSLRPTVLPTVLVERGALVW